jgi:hypothetical protein
LNPRMIAVWRLTPVVIMVRTRPIGYRAWFY